MIKYRGFKASVRKFFMPLKPIRAGFKIYTIAESASGYILNFMVHPHGDRPAKMADVAMACAKHQLNVYHHRGCKRKQQRSAFRFLDKAFQPEPFEVEAPTKSSEGYLLHQTEWPVDSRRLERQPSDDPPLISAPRLEGSCNPHPQT